MVEEEHIIPWWVECLVHDFGPFMDRIGEQSLGTVDDWLNIKTYICSPCNRRFGKKFEEPASQILKPMIRPCPDTNPEEMLLTLADQKTIGRWVTKTLLLRGLIEGVGIPSYYRDWLNCIGQTEHGGMTLPPKGTHVWIAKYPRMAQNMPVLPAGVLEPVHEPRFDWKGSRFHVGEVAMFVLHQRVEIDGTFTHPAEHYEMLSRVLPQHDGPVEWPPNKRVGKTDIAQINGAIEVA